MNEDIQGFIMGLLGDDYYQITDPTQLQEYENSIFRKGVINGYSVSAMKPVMDEIRRNTVKKKSQPSPSDGFQPPVSVESTSDFSAGSIPSYAQQGLGYDYSGAQTFRTLENGTEAQKKVANQELDDLAQAVEDVSYDQAIQTYKWLGYNEEKAVAAANGLVESAKESGKTLGEQLNSTYAWDYNPDLIDPESKIYVEDLQRLKGVESLGQAQAEATQVKFWEDMGMDAGEVATTLGLSMKTHNALYSDYLTPGEDVFSFWLIDEENAVNDEAGLTADMVRFYNRVMVRERLSDLLDPTPLGQGDAPDWTQIAYYQKLLRDNQAQEWETENSFLNAVDATMMGLISPVFESAASMWVGVASDPMSLGAAVTGTLPIQFAKKGFLLEYSSKLLEVIDEMGYNTADPKSLREAFSNPEVIDEAKSRGLKKGIPVAIVDAFSAGFASSIAKKMYKEGYKRLAIQTGEQVVEGAMGAGGEALSQIVETGGVYSWKDVAIEAVGQPIQTAPLKAISAVKNRNISQAEKDYLSYVQYSGDDTHAVTTAARAINYGEINSIDGKIADKKKAIKAAKNKETRATLREELSSLQEQKFDKLNKNIEQIRNLSPEQQAEVQSLANQFNDVLADVRATKRGTPEQRALVETLANVGTKLNQALTPNVPRQTRETATAPLPEMAPVATPTIEEFKQAEAAPVRKPSLVSEAVDSRVTYETPSGEKVGGQLIDEGGGKLVVEADNGQVYEVGNLSEIGFETVESNKMTFEESSVKINEDGTYDVNGKTYSTRGERDINRDENGRVVSVSLRSEDGKVRTIRGNAGAEVAYDILMGKRATRPTEGPGATVNRVTKITRNSDGTISTTTEPLGEGEAPQTPEELLNLADQAIQEEEATKPTQPKRRVTKVTREGRKVVGEPAPEAPTTEAPAEPTAEVPQPQAKPTKPARAKYNAVAGRVRSIKGVSTDQARLINDLAKSLQQGTETSPNIVFWETESDLSEALNLGSPLEAFYDHRSNTIHFALNATPEAIREEMGHAALGGLMSNPDARLRLYEEVVAIGKKNEVIGERLNKLEQVYRDWLSSRRFTQEEIDAIVQEEMIMKVLADYSTNLNQLDASFKAKVVRAINRVLTQFGLKKLTITDDISMQNLAETFRLAYETGRVVNFDTKVKHRPKKGIGMARITEYAEGSGLVPESLKIVEAESFGEIYSAEGASGSKHLVFTHTDPRLAVNQMMASTFFDAGYESISDPVMNNTYEGGEPSRFFGTTEGVARGVMAKRTGKEFRFVTTHNYPEGTSQPVAELNGEDYGGKGNANGAQWWMGPKITAQGLWETLSNFTQAFNTMKAKNGFQQSPPPGFISSDLSIRILIDPATGKYKDYESDFTFDSIEDVLRELDAIAQGGDNWRAVTENEARNLMERETSPDPLSVELMPTLTMSTTFDNEMSLDAILAYAKTLYDTVYNVDGVMQDPSKSEVNRSRALTAVQRFLAVKIPNLNAMIQGAMDKTGSASLPGGRVNGLLKQALESTINELDSSILSYMDPVRIQHQYDSIYKFILNSVDLPYGLEVKQAPGFYTSPLFSTLHMREEAVDMSKHGQALMNLVMLYGLEDFKSPVLTVANPYPSLSMQMRENERQSEMVKPLVNDMINIMDMGAKDPFEVAKVADKIADPVDRIKFLSMIMGYEFDNTNDQVDYEIEIGTRLDKARDEMYGMARLSEQAVADMKGRLVSGRRVGQGQPMKGKDIDVDVDALSQATLQVARQNPALYWKNASKLLEHGILSDLKPLVQFADLMPDKEFDTEGLLPVWHGGAGLSNLGDNKPLFVTRYKEVADVYGGINEQYFETGYTGVTKMYIDEARLAEEQSVWDMMLSMGVLRDKNTGEKVTSMDQVDGMLHETLDIENFGPDAIEGMDISTKDRARVFKALQDGGFMGIKYNDYLGDEGIVVDGKRVKDAESIMVFNPKTQISEGNVKMQSKVELADDIYNEFVERIADNLVWLHDLVDSDVREYSKRWYDGANIIAQDLAGKGDISVEQASAILAALSPSADWFINISNGYRIVRAMTTAQDVEFSPAFTANALEGKLKSFKNFAKGSAKAIYKKHKVLTKSKLTKADRIKYDEFEAELLALEGRTLSEMRTDLERAYFVRYYDAVHHDMSYNIYNPIGEVIDVARKKDGTVAMSTPQSFSNMAKAISIFRDGSQENISLALGGNHKIRNFYNNIANPESMDGDVTMDTHAIAAAELKPFSNKAVEVNENFGSGASSSKPIGISGTYYAYADAYRLAAERVGLLPREIQSITWEAVRILYDASFKANKDNVSRIESIWKEGMSRTDNPILTNRQDIFEDIHQDLLNFVNENDTDTESPRGENLKHPEWYRPGDSQEDKATGSSTQQGDVARGDVPPGGSPGGSTPGDVGAGPDGLARLKIRNTARRFSDMLSQGSAQEIALGATLLTDPKAHFEPQHLETLKGRLKGMTTPELVTMLNTTTIRDLIEGGVDMSTDANILVLAQMEYLERLRRDGDMDRYKAEIFKLSRMGTTFGQLLRQFGEMKSKTPEGFVQLVMSEYEKNNTPLKEENIEVLKDISERYVDAKNRLDDLIDQATIASSESELNSLDKQILAVEAELDAIIEEFNKFQQDFAPNWGSLLSTIMQGNMLTFRSIVVNVVANIATFPIRVAQNILAAPIESILLIAKGRPASEAQLRPSLRALAYGAKRSLFGLKEAFVSVRTGRLPNDWEFSQSYQLRPFRAFVSAFSNTDNLPMAFENDWATANYRAKKFVEGMFGMTASGAFRLLVLGDRPFYRGMEGYELYQIGRQLGLEGDALKQFLRYPTEEQKAKGRLAGLKITFQEDNSFVSWIQKALAAPGSKMRQSSSPSVRAMGNLLKFLVRTQFPFVKTPANILSQSFRLAIPGLSMSRALFRSNVSTKEKAEDMAEAFLSMVLFMASYRLYKMGIISGAVDELSEKARGAAYEAEPPHTINVTALGRYLRGEDLPGTTSGDDRRVGYNKLGLAGAIMGAHVAAFKALDIKQDMAVDDEGKVLEAYGTKPSSPITTMFETTLGLGGGVTTSLMDQSFLTGAENLLNVIQNIDKPDVFYKWIEQTSRAGLSVPLPNSLTSAFRAEREFLPDYRDNDFGQRVKNVIYDRTFGFYGQGTPAPARVNIWGEKITQTPYGANPYLYEFIDATQGRLVTNDPVKVELYNLYKRTGDEDAFPSIPNQVSNRELTIAGDQRNALISTAQANELMMLLGQERTQYLRGIVQSSAWETYDDQTRLNIVRSINNSFANGYYKDGAGETQFYAWFLRKLQLTNEIREANQ